MKWTVIIRVRIPNIRESFGGITAVQHGLLADDGGLLADVGGSIWFISTGLEKFQNYIFFWRCPAVFADHGGWLANDWGSRGGWLADDWGSRRMSEGWLGDKWRFFADHCRTSNRHEPPSKPAMCKHGLRKALLEQNTNGSKKSSFGTKHAKCFRVFLCFHTLSKKQNKKESKHLFKIRFLIHKFNKIQWIIYQIKGNLIFLYHVRKT